MLGLEEVLVDLLVAGYASVLVLKVKVLMIHKLEVNLVPRMTAVLLKMSNLDSM